MALNTGVHWSSERFTKSSTIALQSTKCGYSDRIRNTHPPKTHIPSTHISTTPVQCYMSDGLAKRLTLPNMGGCGVRILLPCAYMSVVRGARPMAHMATATSPKTVFIFCQVETPKEREAGTAYLPVATRQDQRCGELVYPGEAQLVHVRR